MMGHSLKPMRKMGLFPLKPRKNKKVKHLLKINFLIVY